MRPLFTLSGILGRVVFPITVALVIFQFDLDYFESFLYDLRVRHTPVREASENIVLVSIEPSFVEKYRSPPNISQYSEVLKKLSQIKTKTILFIEQPEKISGSIDEKLIFSNYASALKNFHLVVPKLPLTADDSIRLRPPLDRIQTSSGPHTRDDGIFANDGVTRRVLHSFNGNLLLHSTIADLNNDSEVSGLFEFANSQQVYINFAKPKSYKRILFEDLLEGKIPDSEMTGKILIIGSDLKREARKYVYTPFTRERLKMMPLHELHANMLETFILNNAPKRIQGLINLLITLLFSLFTAYVVLAFKPTVGLITIACTAIAYISLSTLAFWPFGIWISLAHPLLAIFICYYLFIPYRLIMENRKSWEYLQKNQLLTQVEELKSNFISMMSHDLRTPLARIRGMSDVIENDRSVKLSADQLEAVKTIKTSSDDLTNLINSILNFGRIESESIKLHKRSKDINEIVEKVVKKKRFLSKRKDIDLICELEPLFSIQLDVELIEQVLANLIENAIKYSAENTKILISTEEADNGRILVQVADQGYGISNEDIDNIFHKFFRSKDTNTLKSKGSGLGLYLAKYFVELHEGEIKVDSQPGQGTTFSVFLPIA